MSRRLASKDKHFTKICNKSAPQYLCELLPTTVGEHSQRSLRNENDLKEMKGRTETFRGSLSLMLLKGIIIIRRVMLSIVMII